MNFVSSPFSFAKVILLMQFETERFRITPLTPVDASAQLSDWTLDPLGAEMLNESQKPWPIEHQRRYFAAQATSLGQIMLGFREKASNRLIGFFLIEPNPKALNYTLTTMIGEKKARGDRVIDEVSEPVHDHFFNKLGYAKAKANVRPHNRAMLWLMANGGWKKEAHLVQHLRESVTGKRVDVLVMAMLAEDWRNYMQRNKKRPWQAFLKNKDPKP